MPQAMRPLTLLTVAFLLKVSAPFVWSGDGPALPGGTPACDSLTTEALPEDDNIAYYTHLLISRWITKPQKEALERAHCLGRPALLVDAGFSLLEIEKLQARNVAIKGRTHGHRDSMPWDFVMRPRKSVPRGAPSEVPPPPQGAQPEKFDPVLQFAFNVLGRWLNPEERAALVEAERQDSTQRLRSAGFDVLEILKLQRNGVANGKGTTAERAPKPWDGVSPPP